MTQALFEEIPSTGNGLPPGANFPNLNFPFRAEEAQPTDTAQPNRRPNVFERAIAVQITMNKFGVRRKVGTNRLEVAKSDVKYQDDDTATVEIDTNVSKPLLSASKKILDCTEYKEIVSVESEIRVLLKTRTLPSIMKSGVYLVPVESLESVDTDLNALLQKRQEKVDALIAVFPERVRETQENLGVLANPADYPPVEALKEMFSATVQYVNFGVPGRLEQINRALFLREKEKAEKLWSEASQEIVQVLRLQMSELVDHMVERLQPGSDGKEKKFKDSTVKNLVEYLDGFDARNVVNDADLGNLVGKAKQLLQGIDPEMIRDTAGLKDKLREGFSELKANLDPLIENKPKRKISFKD